MPYFGLILYKFRLKKSWKLERLLQLLQLSALHNNASPLLDYYS